MANVEQNGTQPQQEEFRIPDFLVNLIGKQQVQIAALEAQLQMFQMQQSQPATPAQVPVSAPAATTPEVV